MKVVMNTINHALWGATIGGTVGMPIEGAIISSIPDLLTIPFIGYFMLKDKTQPYKTPKRIRVFYEVLHNWFVAGSIVALAFMFSRIFGVLTIGYLWHVIEDAPFHKNMASRFLWPLWKGRIQIISVSEHKWIQVVDLLLIASVNLVLSLKLF